MPTIAFTPLPGQPSAKKVTNLWGTAPIEIPGKVSPEIEDAEEAEEITEEEYLEDEDEYTEDEDDGIKAGPRNAITRLTIAIIPIGGIWARPREKQSTRYIDLTDVDLSGTEMYYDEGDKAEMYARFGAKLGKTREEVKNILFGY